MTSVLAVSSSAGGIAEKASRRSSRFSIFLSVLLTACGVLAILLPIETSFGVVIVLSWLLMLTGTVQFVHVFRCKGVGHGIWKVLIALVYVTTGIYFRLNLGIGIAALTLALIAFFIAQGLIDVFAYFRTRKLGASGWVLLDGAVTFLLGLMIWRHWPSGSLWAIGILVGVNMMSTGITRLMLAMAVRRARLTTDELTTETAS